MTQVTLGQAIDKVLTLALERDMYGQYEYWSDAYAEYGRTNREMGLDDAYTAGVITEAEYTTLKKHA